MRVGIFRLVVSVLLLFSLASLPSFAYIIRGEIEDVWLVRPDNPYVDEAYYPPEYLELEDLVFYTCLEEDNLSVESTVICLDDNSFDDVEVRQWSDRNCFIGDYDLASHDCNNLLIRSTYELGDEAVTLEREIKENRLTSLMDHIENSQYSDGGWADVTDTAYGIWAMSHFPDIYTKEISLGLDWLKDYRDNDDKCWPDGTCSPYITANVLGLLSLAGFNTSLRILHDGYIWLERMQNYYTPDDEWELNVTPYFFDSECLITYDGVNTTVSISLNDSYFYDIAPEYPKDLYVICTEAVQATIETQDGEVVLYYEGDNLTYTMPGAGWANGDRWSDADIGTSLWAVLANISQIRRDAALEWMTHELHLEGNRGKYIGDSQNSTNAALYLMAINRTPIKSAVYDDYDINYSMDDVLQWIRFEQNNEGSWGDGNVSTNMIPTGVAVMSLLGTYFNRTDEVIEDAEEWTSENELEYGWNTTQKNAYAFHILKNNARPFLKSVPRVVVMDSGVQTIEIYNPTTYDLTDLSFDFSDNLDGLVSIETQDAISAYSYIRLDIEQLQTDVEDTYGFLTIKNGDMNISKIPVMVVSFPSINLTAQESIRVFGTKGLLKFGITKTSDTFNCELDWDDPDISSKTDFRFVSEQEVAVDIKFTKAERLEKDYTGDFICTIRDKSFLIPFEVNIDRYPSYPISVSPDRIYINATGQEPTFQVKNLLDETLDVTIGFVKSEDFFDIEKTKLVLNPSETRNLTIYNVIPKGFNVTSSNSIEVTALGQKESIKFLADVISEPRFRLNPIVFYGILGLILLAIGGAGYWAYLNQEKISRWLKPGSKIEDVRNRIRKLEDKGTSMAIANYARMLRFQGKQDSDIRKRLKEEGFKDEEIDKTFRDM